MLAEPNRTPYDLNFRLFGFPIRVHPLFWLGAALLGASTLKLGLVYMAIWIGVVLVSLVVHELGHAIAFRRFGSDSRIVLWMFGGLAVPNSAVAGRWRRVLIALAGPIAGFILCAAVYFSNEATQWGSGKFGIPLAYLCYSLIFVNLFWGIFNLLPVFPLDGGRVSQELCEWKWRGRGLVIAVQISVWVAGAVAVYCLLGEMELRNGGGPITSNLPWWVPIGSIFTAILFAMLAVQNYQLLQQLRNAGYYQEASDDRLPWEK